MVEGDGESTLDATQRESNEVASMSFVVARQDSDGTLLSWSQSVEVVGERDQRVCSREGEREGRRCRITGGS